MFLRRLDHDCERGYGVFQKYYHNGRKLFSHHRLRGRRNALSKHRPERLPLDVSAMATPEIELSRASDDDWNTESVEVAGFQSGINKNETKNKMDGMETVSIKNDEEEEDSEYEDYFICDGCNAGPIDSSYESLVLDDYYLC